MEILKRGSKIVPNVESALNPMRQNLFFTFNNKDSSYNHIIQHGYVKFGHQHATQSEYDCLINITKLSTRQCCNFKSVYIVLLAMTDINEVHVLFEGYSFTDPDDKNTMRANCSSTLIKAPNNMNIIVDTMTPWDGNRMLEALSSKGLKADDISIVINTHGHSDHTGNNNLFPNTKWLIVGESISQRDKYLFYDFKNPYNITEGIYVMSTPGHTQTCVSVIIENTNLGGKVGICGDLFEKEEDISDCSIWLSAGSEDPEKQANNRQKIAQLVDYVIPGHGKGFKITDDMRRKLEDHMNNR